MKAYNHGLVIADIAHMPGGICGTWPAFWMVPAGPNNWPAHGEIDIIEDVNAQSSNQMTLHSSSGRAIANTEFTGTLVTPNCAVDPPNHEKNAGCAISDSNPASYGAEFNADGGGVYAMEWTSDSIKVFFFVRYHIPFLNILNKGASLLGSVYL